MASAPRSGPCAPIAPNALWALDFQFDTTEDNRTIKLLNIVDEFTRECPAIVVERSIDADLVVATLDRLALDPGRTGLRQVRQRARVHRACRGRLVPVQRRRLDLHRPGLPLAERLDRVVQRTAPRRAAQRLALRQPARGQGDHRGLADRLQLEPATLGPRRPHAKRVPTKQRLPMPSMRSCTPPCSA